MKARVDLAISPPGLIRGARCHTLVIDDEGVAIVAVCRGWRVGFNPRGALNKQVANATIRHLRGKAEAATREVTEASYRDRLTAKGSVRLAPAQITDVVFDAEWLDLRFVGAGKKHRFQFEAPEAAAATAFAAALAALR